MPPRYFSSTLLFWTILCAWMMLRRSATAFLPRRTLATHATTAPNNNNKSTLRRPRKDYDGHVSMKFVEHLQSSTGRYSDFTGSAFITPAMRQENYVAELPSLFPLQMQKKDNGNVPTRMRFAPSPTGSLHVGGARTALYNWLVAKKGQQRANDESAFVVRVEDTDVARSTKESEESVLGDLEWLGLTWDEGPDMYTHYGPYRQSERSEIYFAAAQRLLSEGKAYKCFCTAEELAATKAEQEQNGQVARYDGKWRDADPELVHKMVSQNKPYTIRFRVPENARVVIDDIVRGTVSWDAQATVGDFILLRSTGVPVYNFCVAVDDASMGISTVVRAEEHLTNTVRQALVLDALNAPRPKYAHCSLILGEDKQKLSKRHGATSCNQYRLDGFLPDAMINYLALLGWNDGTDNEIFTRDELIDAFELERVVKSPSVFDLEKLKWVNSQHLKMMSVESLIPFVSDQMDMEKMWKDDIENINAVKDFTMACITLAKQMMETTKDAALNAKTVLGYGLPASFDQLQDEEARAMVEHGHFYPIAQRILSDYDANTLPLPREDPLVAFKDPTGQAIEMDAPNGGAPCDYTQEYMSYMKQVAKELKSKGRNLFHPVRLMLTGEMSGQDVTKQLSLLALADAPDSVVNKETVDVVSLDERMQRLRAFCETVPEEFRTPQTSASVRKAKDEGGTSLAGTESTLALTDVVAAAAADPKDSYDGPPISALDIRVGRVTKVWEHPEADKLFCEEIDVGEDEPRQIASGLKPFMKPEDLEGRKVLVLCNLKARKLVGFPSHGMVLCASNTDHTEVKLVAPPEDAQIGERVTVPDFNFEGDEGQPFAENKIGKKKVFEKIAPHLKTSQYGVPEFLGRPLMTSAGVCTSPLSDGSVS